MDELEGIDSFCGQDGAPGLITIEYLPVSWINPSQYAQIILNRNWQKDIGIISGVAGWLKAKVQPSEQLWQERHQDSTAGDYYEQEVSAIAPGLKPTVTGEFEKMDQYDFLLRLVDQDNQKWILGTRDFPFRFFADGTSGNDGTEKNYAIRFVASTRHRAYGFVPAF